MGLSNIAGIGGGGVAIPIIMATFHHTTKPAIGISSFSILMTTIARFIMNINEHHPEKPNVVVIDYDLVAIMMPTTLAGAQIGALILIIFPSLFIVVILTFMLTFLTVQSLRKAIAICNKENKERLAKSAVNKPNTSQERSTQPIELSTNVTKFSSNTIEEEGGFNVSVVNPDE